MEIGHWNAGSEMRHILRRAAALVLCAALAVSLAPAASAAETESAVQTDAGTSVENTYVLAVTTGASAGENIPFFAVRYRDNSGAERKKYILACEGDLDRGCETAAKAGGSAQTRAARVQELTGYQAGTSDSLPRFASYTTDTYLFETKDAIREILDVEIYTRSSGSWTCQGLRIYQAEQLYGLEMNGYYSSQYQVSFSGTLLAEMVGIRTDSDGGTHTTFNWDVDRCFTLPADSGSGGTNGYLNTTFSAQEAAYDGAPGQSEYFFELAFQDTADSGVESLVNYYSAGGPAALKDMGIYEPITLTVRYTDRYGDVRQVAMPVVTSAVAWAVEMGVSADSKLLGLAQQGETVGFAGYLSDCASVDSYTLDYGASAAEGAASLQHTGDAGNYNTRVAEQSASADSIQLSYVAVYELSQQEASVSVEGGTLRPEVMGSPAYYYTQTRERLEVGGRASHDLLAYQKGAQLRSRTLENQYLVSVTTDTMSSAGTTADLSIQLHYKNKSGDEKNTNTYEIRSMIRDYTGYWPGDSGDVAYLASVRAGGTANMLFTLSDVSEFTGVSLSASAASSDDWQVKSIQILQLTSLGDREVSLDENGNWATCSGGSWQSDRVITRTYDGTQVYVSNAAVLIQGGDTKEISGGDTSGGGSGESGGGSGGSSSGGSGGSSGGTVTDWEADWSDLRYSMSYEQSTQNLGFTKVRNTYTVTVNVADDAATSGEDGDCGSKNQFYFQLIFENGRSGYVLANQQLSADRFRAGYQETFTVSTNRDYGELVSVSIIPDDLSSDSEVFDKLKIDSISVTQNTDSGMSKEWGISQVGWITIDYHDDGEKSSIRGQSGRSEAELAQTFNVDSSSHVINLLVTLATAPYQSSPQLTGSVTGTLTYRTRSGELQTQTFDVVEKMYQYANKAAQRQRDASGNTVSSSKAVSDPDWMFRENHTDRFTIGVKDAEEIISLTLSVNSQAATYWNLEGISVSTIASSGTLSLNANDEYERSSTTELLATHNSSAEPYAYTLFCPMNTTEELIVNFTTNNIEISESEGSWSAVVSREPRSTNDTLNLYVFPSEDGDSPSAYSVEACVQYSKFTGGIQQTAVGNTTESGGSSVTRSLNWSEEKEIFYAIGIDAHDMSTLNNVTLKAEGQTAVLANIDHAIVQRVRSGVVVSVYYIDFGGANIVYKPTKSPAASSVLPVQRQTASIKLGESMSEEALTAETRDLAVAIRYTTTLDADDRVYTSPYIYLTDQSKTALAAGELLTVDFHQTYVKDIVGLNLIATGDLSVEVDGAYVTTWQGGSGEDEEEVRQGWYSIAEQTRVAKTGTVLRCTASGGAESGSLSDLEIAMDVSGSTSTDAPLKVRIGYLDHNGAAQVSEIQDMRLYASGGGSSDEESTSALMSSRLTAHVLLENAQEIRWLTIEPSGQSGESCYVGSVALKLQGADQISSATSPVNQTARCGSPLTVNLANLSVTLTGSTENPLNGSTTSREVTNDTVGLAAKSGAAVTVNVTVNGSQAGFTAKAEYVNGTAVADADEYLSVSGSTLTFRPPDNTGDAVMNYRITVTSAEISTVSAAVEVAVEPEPKPDPVEIPDEAAGGDPSSGGTDSEGSGGGGAE